MIANMKVFDCSLREIGYQTGWHFDTKFAQDIYRFAEARSVDYIELGFFHSPDADPGRGCFRYCSVKNDEVEAVFSYMKNRTKLSAMRDIQRPLTELLPKKDSPIDAIRILTRSHETEIDILKKHIDEVQRLGYEVFVNFTSSGANTMEKNRTFAKVVSEMGVQTIYFADTESIMTPEYVCNTIDVCREEHVKVGMHFHDKNGTAENLANIAIQKGIDGIDVTHIGLGGKWRDGNLTMEFLLKKFGFPIGYEGTILRNEIIDQLIKYHPYSAAD